MHAMDETEERPGLVRRADRRLIAGVAGGLADHFGVDAWVFRLGFVLAAFAGGMGVVAYLLLWFLIRRQDLPRSAAQQMADRFPDAPAWIGLVLIGIGIVSLASQLGIHAGAVGWALLLIGGGFLLFRRGEDARAEPVDGTSPLPELQIPGDTPPPPPRARRPRERSPLGWLSFGVALAVSGLVAVLRNAGIVDLTLAQAFAIPLVILGAGLLVGTVIGRARWTVLLGVPLIPIVLIASAFTVPLTGHTEELIVRHSAQVRSSYELSGGRLELVLWRIEPAELPPSIDVRMGAGSVEVVLPPRGVRVEATVNIGDVHMGQSRGGFDVQGSQGDPNATTVVTVHVDVGEVQTWVNPLPRARGGNAA
jgi:phage shock protein PspC (stress-responsive transcriptional regulator)